MATRVVSGIIFPGTALVGDNEVTISFNPHERTSGTANVSERREVGPDGGFTSTPCKAVSLRQIEVKGNPFQDDAGFIVDDDISPDTLTVRWRHKKEGFISEITYMVIGEVPDPVTERDDPDDGDNPLRPPGGGDGRDDADKRGRG